ncbi:glutathione peroxidase [Sulfitobacter sp. HNIBRBA3233]|uniref:glutathione peroxidase n=1 Tax=Sulfitobacter marinivivus TaxID=3158558 RepID=UPI0032DF426C
MRSLMTLIVAFIWSGAVAAAPLDAVFASIDGGEIRLRDYSGQPVLVVNTASQCAFTRQYDGLQALYDRYRDAGLVVLAIPSDDFNQELDTAAEVKEFCEINFNLDLPMTDMTHVRGPRAHGFYRDVAAQTGFVPRWNFNKVLIGTEGEIIQTWGSSVRPMSQAITAEIEKALK